jgi:hypothetical protein
METLDFWHDDSKERLKKYIGMPRVEEAARKMKTLVLLGILDIGNTKVVLVDNQKGFVTGWTLKKVSGNWFLSNEPEDDLKIAIIEAALSKAGDAFKPILYKELGSYDNVKSETGEHCYGFSLSLWGDGKNVHGLLDHHVGLCGDPQCTVVLGEIIDNELTLTATHPIFDKYYKLKGTMGSDEIRGKMNSVDLTLKASDNKSGSDQTFEKWCETWSSVQRCAGVKELCRQ